MANLQRVDSLVEGNLVSVDMASQCSQCSLCRDMVDSRCRDMVHPSSSLVCHNQVLDTVLLKACHKLWLLANSHLHSSRCMATVRPCKDSQGNSPRRETHTANLPSEVAGIEMKERQERNKVLR